MFASLSTNVASSTAYSSMNGVLISIGIMVSWFFCYGAWKSVFVLEISMLFYKLLDNWVILRTSDCTKYSRRSLFTLHFTPVPLQLQVLPSVQIIFGRFCIISFLSSFSFCVAAALCERHGSGFFTCCCYSEHLDYNNLYNYDDYVEVLISLLNMDLLNVLESSIIWCLDRSWRQVYWWLLKRLLLLFRCLFFP